MYADSASTTAPTPGIALSSCMQIITFLARSCVVLRAGLSAPGTADKVSATMMLPGTTGRSIWQLHDHGCSQPWDGCPCLTSSLWRHKPVVISSNRQIVCQT